jgi:hypothetical protein
MRAATAVLLGAALVIAPGHGRAAFELRDPSPAALGAASIDLSAPAFFDPPAEAPPNLWRGLEAGASHAALFGVDGYAADAITAGRRVRSLEAAASYLETGGVGAMEHTARLAIGESVPRPVALEVTAERLDLAVDGVAGAGGWALGGGARSRVEMPRLTLDLRVLAERAFRSASLDALGVEPSVAVGVALRAGAARIAFLDRWEGGGRRSPRVLFDLLLGGAAVVRVARGESPSRTGAALALRAGRLEAAAGRLDLAWGSAITGFSLALLPAPKGWGTP